MGNNLAGFGSVDTVMTNRNSRQPQRGDKELGVPAEGQKSAQSSSHVYKNIPSHPALRRFESGNLDPHFVCQVKNQFNDFLNTWDTDLYSKDKSENARIHLYVGVIGGTVTPWIQCLTDKAEGWRFSSGNSQTSQEQHSDSVASVTCCLLLKTQE